jgi:hypothetical protein
MAFVQRETLGCAWYQRWANPGAERDFCRLAVDSYKNAKAFETIGDVMLAQSRYFDPCTVHLE